MVNGLPDRDSGGPTNIVLLGPPAGGKGTQAEFLVARYGMVHISTGDLLRARSKFMPELAQFMDNGKLVPDEVVSAVLKDRLMDADCGSRGVLLDGFPRTRAQAESLREAGVVVSDVIHLNVADDIVIARIVGRRIDPVSGKIYHIVHNPPPPEVESRVIQRSDDTIEKAKTRLEIYHNTREGIVNFYGDLVKTIYVGGNAPHAFREEVTPGLVFDKVREALEGDTYRGSVMRHELIAKDFECGNHATSLQAVARYFEHSRFRMLRQGCLADTVAVANRVVLRAQVVDMAICLRPLQKYKLRTWLEHVGHRAVLLSHALSQQSKDGTVEDVARGSSAVVFLTEFGQALDIPKVKELRDLVDPTTALRGHYPVNVVATASPDAMKETIGRRPDGCWHDIFYVAADDVDLNGSVHQAVAFSYFERLRVKAAAEGGYPGMHRRLVLKGDTVRTYATYVGFATVGDRLKGFTWIFTPAVKAGERDGSLHLAFEISNILDEVLISGCVVVSPPAGEFVQDSRL